MNMLFVSILRGSVSAVLNVVLLFSLAQPKYGRKTTNLAMLGLLFVNLLTTLFFYLSGNITALAKFNIFLYLLLYLAAKPLFRDTFMQWLFNFITVINFALVITVVSFLLSRHLPAPMYMNTLLRLLLYASAIFLFRRLVRPLYRQVVEHWSVFALVAIGIFLNFMQYFLFSKDIVDTLEEKSAPLLLLILLAVLIYTSVFFALKKLSGEFERREEDIRAEAHQQMLQSELSAYQEYVSISRQNRHDLRHHTALLSECLAHGDVEGARAYLQQYEESLAESTLRQYCSHGVANAIFRLYERRARDAGIAFAVLAEIPDELPVSDPELGVLLSNLLENACEASGHSADPGKFISFSAETDGDRLRLEVTNTVSGTVRFEGELPVSTKPGGGIGTKSVSRLVKHYGGMLRFKQTEDKFIAQVILPLDGAGRQHA